jgi:pimeloyl-ACP methyl ester carboxylesterase
MFAQSDFNMWVASTYFRSMMVSLIGVPKEMLAQLTPEDEKHVDDILATLLPVKPRSKGILFDAYGAPSDIATFPFEQVRAPTIMFHAKDDPLPSFRSTLFVAERIPNAKFVAFEKGGHLLLGNEDVVESEILNFLTHCINLEADEKRDLSGPLYKLNPRTRSTR